MKVYKVVLTGGPCAGKSKILKKLVEYYKSEENKVFIVAETATEVLSSGVKFLEMDIPINFQNIIFDRQINKEQTLYWGMQHIPLKKNNIVFLDRGLIDNKAYLHSQYEFDRLLEDYFQKELEVLDSYDLVIDLISLATTDPELYLELYKSNEERYEDPETAQIIDKKTTEAWLGHRNVKYVYPTEKMEEKIPIIINYIDALLQAKPQKGTETYWIENPTDILMFLDDENPKEIECIDYYLKNRKTIDSKNQTILRKRVYKGCESKLIIVLDESGSKIIDRVIRDDYWDFLETTYGIEKKVKKLEYTTNKLGSVCKITCYDSFTTLDIPITNYRQENDIINNFKVIEKIDNLEEFLDNQNKNIAKVKKYGTI